MTNDNGFRNLTTKTHSLTLRLLADGSYVLSLFKLGADGAADLDEGEVFVKEIPAKIPGHPHASPVAVRAESQWNDAAGLLRCTAERLDSEISGVYQWAASVSSCPVHHSKTGKLIPGGLESLRRECETLSRAIRDLELCAPIRKSERLEARRVQALEHGRTVLANGRRQLTA